jgi:hypothetical protein
MLSRIKLPLVDIKRALLEVDDSSLSVDDLRSIARHLPTAEEVTMSYCILSMEMLTIGLGYATENIW